MAPDLCSVPLQEDLPADATLQVHRSEVAAQPWLTAEEREQLRVEALAAAAAEEHSRQSNVGRALQEMLGGAQGCGASGAVPGPVRENEAAAAVEVHGNRARMGGALHKVLGGVQTCSCLGGQGPVSCAQGLS